MFSFQSKPFLLLVILGAFSAQTASACADDATFTFDLVNIPTTTVTCSWLTKNLKKASIRKAAYCPTVKTKCVKSCGNCPATKSPTASPQKSPTASPQASPSAKPSTSKAPSPVPSAKPSAKPSQAPSAKPSAKPSQAPSDKPSAKPSVKPSAKPSQAPSDKPSAKPSVSQKPTLSKMPSSAPSDGCKDSSTYMFKVESTGAAVKCSWLTKNNSSTKTAARILKYCADTQTKFQCTKSCGTCKIPPCVDDATHTFPIPATGKTGNCAWITKNIKKKTTRQAAYCGANGAKCPLSCGYCL